MSSKKSDLFKNITAGLTGGASFAVFFGLGMNPIAAGAISCAGYLATGLLLKSKKDTPPPEDSDLPLIEKVLADGQKKLATMQKSNGVIRKVSVNKTIKKIVNIAEKIYKEIEEHPKKFNSAHMFLTYYPETTLKIIDQYIELSAHATVSDDIYQALSKVEYMLETISEAYSKQLANLMESDIMDLDIELEVLKTTFINEGFEDIVHDK